MFESEFERFQIGTMGISDASKLEGIEFKPYQIIF